MMPPLSRGLVETGKYSWKYAAQSDYQRAPTTALLTRREKAVRTVDSGWTGGRFIVVDLLKLRREEGNGSDARSSGSAPDRLVELGGDRFDLRVIGKSEGFKSGFMRADDCDASAPRQPHHTFVHGRAHSAKKPSC